VDSIADIGGMHGFGHVTLEPPDGPPFHEPWERRAFAMALLSMRVSGSNLEAFRHALERLDPVQYYGEGYYGRWLHCGERLLLDSNILAPGAVEARARVLRGEDVAEPAAPEPAKPEYQPTAAGSTREVEDQPRFKVGQHVLTQRVGSERHSRLPRYVRGLTGTVERIQPAHVLPETHAHFEAENAQHVYKVGFPSASIWGADAEPFTLTIDLWESYLEAAS
jgi:nitrile hydratase subunit beta